MWICFKMSFIAVIKAEFSALLLQSSVSHSVNFISYFQFSLSLSPVWNVFVSFLSYLVSLVLFLFVKFKSIKCMSILSKNFVKS